MRILLVSPLPPPEGGIAIWTKQYVNYCKNNNIDLSVVNIAVRGKRSKRINDNRHIIDEIKRTFSIISDLRKKLRSFNPDYIHINSACAKWGLIRDAICVSIAKKSGAKVVLNFRCTVQDKLGDGSFRRKLFLKMTSKSDLVLTLNRVSEEFIKNNVYSVKVKTVPNFISLDNVQPVLMISKSIDRILYVGHVQFDKGVREIIKVAEEFPSKCFVLAGPVSDEVNSIDIPQNVKLLGRVEHSAIQSLMMNSDLFLFPSYTEGFSNALVEAMAYGLPVIASDVGANKDMIENKGGVIVPAQNSDVIIRAIKLLESADIRQKMSLWNKDKVFKRYRVDIVMKQLLSIYENI